MEQPQRRGDVSVGGVGRCLQYRGCVARRGHFQIPRWRRKLDATAIDDLFIILLRQSPCGLPDEQFDSHRGNGFWYLAQHRWRHELEPALQQWGDSGLRLSPDGW